MSAWGLLVLASAAVASPQPEAVENEGRGISPSTIAPIEESPDAWLMRRRGLKVGVQLGAGFSGLVGIPLSFGLGRVSAYVMPEGQFQWPFVFTTAAFFVGVDAGLLVHLWRRFSFGAGGMIGLHPGAPYRPVVGFSVTPVMVHLGDREQHTLLIYVPVLFNYFTTVPLPMLGYGLRFN